MVEEIIELVAFFTLGLLFGSFANVIIYRVPLGQSVVRPRSRCPHCQKLVRWYDNIPIISWLFLRARCRHCQERISWRYPLVELLTAILFTAVFCRVGWSWLLLEYLLFVYGLIIVSFIDFDHRILPDLFTLPGIVIGLLGALLSPDRNFWPAFAGFLLGGGFLWLIAYVYLLLRKEEGMGGGDIKLLAWIGAVLDWQAVPFVILVSSLVGSAVGLIVASRTKEGLKATIPFGPYLCLGAIVYLLWGQQIAIWYLQLFLPGLMPVN